ncbi:hypothetical protein [Aeribacillus sp. FSL M8-0254]|uniref:hypothetical protein n=1 Tax=Aeribacillus sp. FSL M8-0254 TaxID=2954577 RepID=UPI0030FA83E1
MDELFSSSAGAAFAAWGSNIIILLISYSTIAGVVGAGGLGDFAVRNGYYRYQPDIMLATVVIMIILVSIIQISGSRLASFLDKR